MHCPGDVLRFPSDRSRATRPLFQRSGLQRTGNTERWLWETTRACSQATWELDVDHEDVPGSVGDAAATQRVSRTHEARQRGRDEDALRAFALIERSVLQRAVGAERSLRETTALTSTPGARRLPGKHARECWRTPRDLERGLDDVSGSALDASAIRREALDEVCNKQPGAVDVRTTRHEVSDSQRRRAGGLADHVQASRASREWLRP
ncbi:hypothetical protein C8T65DRAFT_677630 [Cerioporus squamosus]|nr:hypothetical protein C8T65DRAFT_677630 [Cerioporus squamosus]